MVKCNKSDEQNETESELGGDPSIVVIPDQSSEVTSSWPENQNDNIPDFIADGTNTINEAFRNLFVIDEKLKPKPTEQESKIHNVAE